MASNSNGKRLPPRVGEDGRLYFNYGVGAKWRFEGNGNIKDKLFEESKETIFEIVDCRYSDSGVEYYKCTNNGVPFWNEFSANRIYHILDYGLHKQISEGARRELPLTVEEVKTFVIGKAMARATAVKTLGNTDYFAKDKELRSIQTDKVFAEVKGQMDKLAELTDKEKKLKGKQAQILKTKNIDPAILKEVDFCSDCHGTGVTNSNKVCDCAKKLEAEIKNYNAILRRKSQKTGATE